MKTCFNCQTQFWGNFCPTCGTPAMEPTPNAFPEAAPPKQGIVSSVIRLLLLTVCNVSAIAVFVYGMFRESAMSLWAKFVDAFASSAMLVLLGVWFWLLIKFIVFAVPKTCRAAKKIFETIIPLNFFTFAIESMICLCVAFIPISAGTTAFSSILLIMEYISENPTNILVPLIVMVVSAVATFFLSKMEIRKVFGAKNTAESI